MLRWYASHLNLAVLVRFALLAELRWLQACRLPPVHLVDLRRVDTGVLEPLLYSQGHAELRRLPLSANNRFESFAVHVIVAGLEVSFRETL